MRSTKDELIKKGVLLPDGFDKDQDCKNGKYLIQFCTRAVNRSVKSKFIPCGFHINEN